MSPGAVRPVFSCLLMVALLHGRALHSAERDAVEVTITDKVLVKDCTRFGVNLSGGNALLKKPVAVNFEGTSHRICSEGEVFRDGFLCYVVGEECNRNSHVDKFWPGGRITLLSGPAKGQQRTITGVEFREAYTFPYTAETREKPKVAFVRFDKPIEGLPEEKRADFDKLVKDKAPSRQIRAAYEADPMKNVGALIHKDYLDVGYFGPGDGVFRADKDNGVTKTVQGDTPPGSFGVSALLVESGDRPAKLTFNVCRSDATDCNAACGTRFWAKRRSGEAKLSVQWSVPQDPRPVPLTDAWKLHELSFDLRGKFADRLDAKARQERAAATFCVEGGAILLDDVEIWREGDRNPTAFRDDIVEILREGKVGVLRWIQHGGSNIANVISPRMRQHYWDGTVWSPKGDPQKLSWWSTQKFYALHEMYELCEHLGIEPWFCLPGTLYWEEMDAFMEYLGGPASTPGGKLRIAQGHPRPWTETLRRIHVEFANEIWNWVGDYKTSSYDGPEYWNDLILRAKRSPYYKPNTIFTLGTDGKTKWYPDADRLMTRAPYIMHELTRETIAKYPTRDDLVYYLFAHALEQNTLNERRNALAQEMLKAGKELAVYEVNYHITKPDDTLATRNELVTSLAAGVNLANSMLSMVKLQHTRTQCFFSFHGNYFQTRLWGGVLSLRADRKRYRPTWLAVTLANQVIEGDLVETIHDGNSPQFAVMVHDRQGSAKAPGEKRYPAVWSYAFRNGAKRALVLLNLHLKDAQPVALRLDRDPAGPAESWLLHAPDYAANNEPEHEPQVSLKQATHQDFRREYRLTLPPCSALALRWEVGEHIEPPAAAAKGTKTSMKGWELYVWQEGGADFFSLLPGTNRLKADDEIKKAAVKGIAAIKAALDELKQGQMVLLCGRRLPEAPPEGPAREIREYCKRIELDAKR